MDGEQPAAVVPQYVKIAADLREKIKNGFYGPGALLPSRNEITTMYGVSAITARDALSVLSHEGYAKAIRGRGHIVRRKRSRLTVPDPAVLGGRARSRRCRWTCTASTSTRRHLRTTSRCRWRPAATHRCGCAAPSTSPPPTASPCRSTSAGCPACPPMRRPALRDVRRRPPWPAVVQDITGRTVATVVQHTRARGANPWEAEAFGIPDKTIVLVTHATLYDGQRRPIEHSRWTWPTDGVRISDYYTYRPGN